MLNVAGSLDKVKETERMPLWDFMEWISHERSKADMQANLHEIARQKAKQ